MMNIMCCLSTYQHQVLVIWQCVTRYVNVCLGRWGKGAAEAGIGNLQSSLGKSMGCCDLGYSLWSCECISGWHCYKDHQEKEPGIGWTIAACLSDLLCLFLSGGNGEPAATCVLWHAQMEGGVKWTNGCWVPLYLGNREALWKLLMSLTLSVYPIKSILTSKLATHTTLCLNFCGKW